MRTLPLSEAEIVAWITLCSKRGLGPVALRRLLTRFGLPTEILSHAPQDLMPTLDAKGVTSLLQHDPRLPAQIQRTLDWCALDGNWLLTLADPAYPRALLDLHDAPPLLYVRGKLALLQRPSVAIVGSRHGTAQGTLTTESLAAALASAGVPVVSGLALGIDAAAHRGALATSGETIAVVGTGVDIVYPSRHARLAAEIAERGTIISENALGETAQRQHFPRRNRLIAALSRGVVVVEAAVNSGSLITARCAGDLGRQVFAMPGSIHSPLSKGCHQLIRDGATLVESRDHVLEGLGLEAGLELALDLGGEVTPVPVPITSPTGSAGDRPTGIAASHSSDCAQPDSPQPGDAALLSALGHDPLSVEALARRSGLHGAALQTALLRLELRGHIERLPGARVGRLVRPG
ncbi:MAG: DNA-processing protein DprA [Janthinobacterium lividum]